MRHRFVVIAAAVVARLPLPLAVAAAIYVYDMSIFVDVLPDGTEQAAWSALLPAGCGALLRPDYGPFTWYQFWVALLGLGEATMLAGALVALNGLRIVRRMEVMPDGLVLCRWYGRQLIGAQEGAAISRVFWSRAYADGWCRGWLRTSAPDLLCADDQYFCISWPSGKRIYVRFRVPIVITKAVHQCSSANRVAKRLEMPYDASISRQPLPSTQYTIWHRRDNSDLYSGGSCWPCSTSGAWCPSSVPMLSSSTVTAVRCPSIGIWLAGSVKLSSCRQMIPTR